jgi:hypothetical protein
MKVSRRTNVMKALAPAIGSRRRLCGALVVFAVVAGGCSAKDRDVAGGGNQFDVASGPSASFDGASADPGVTDVASVAGSDSAPGAVTGGASGAAATGAATGAATSGGSGTARATATGGAAPSAPTAAVGGKTGPGITASTVKIGFVYSQELESVAGVADRPNAQALVDGMNREGGIAGRKIEVAWHDWPITSQQTIEQREQGMCAAFTEDNKVFAVDPYWIPTENLAGCLTAKDTMTIAPAGAGTPISFDTASFEKYPTHLWALATPTPQRLAKPFVAMLK